MNDYLEFDEIIVKVQELYSNHKPRLFCDECGKSFYLVERDPETDNLVISYDDHSLNVKRYCFDHLYYDLFVDNTAIEYVPVIERSGKLRFINHARAKLFLDNRRN